MDLYNHQRELIPWNLEFFYLFESRRFQLNHLYQKQLKKEEKPERYGKREGREGFPGR